MFKKYMLFLLLLNLNACAFWRFDEYHVLLRSDVITSPEIEKQILAKASLGRTEDGRIRVLKVKGSPYERGYQHGALLRAEVRDNMLNLYDNAISTFKSKELFAEAFERARPFIPQEYLDEMHGLAHGAKLPLDVIHAVHILPSLTEWGGKKRLKELAKGMIAGQDLGTSCSNFSTLQSTTADGSMYTVRILDWGLHKISKLHEYPLILVEEPDTGHSSAVLTWVGFIGAVSGLNDQSITLGEMGYGDPESETLRGLPMIFLLRNVLTYAGDLKEVQHILKSAPPTDSYVFLMSDGKNNAAEMYVKDPTRFLVFKPGEPAEDQEKVMPGIPNIVYGGHFEDLMHESLTKYNGQFSPEIIQEKIIPYTAMKSNFQNVVYKPGALQLWVNNAGGPSARAAEQPYTFFDLGKALSN